MVYDKLEYCDWREDDTEDTVQWNLPQVTRDGIPTVFFATFRSRALLTLIFFFIIISKSLWGILTPAAFI